MPPQPHETVLFDVEDAKVYKLTTDIGASPAYGAAVDVPGIAQFGLNIGLVTAELRGDGKLFAVKGRLESLECPFTYDRLALDVIDVILQTAAGVEDPAPDLATSSRVRFKGKNSLPEFGAGFLITDTEDALGVASVRIYLARGQLTAATIAGQQSNQFGQPSGTIRGLATRSNDVIGALYIDTVETALGAFPALHD